ncbi:MAG TPA: amidohydrolase family protein [Dongiaceae bacterium]|nr:amidohydrolase family protein [Dongiaceae bacterium]
MLIRNAEIYQAGLSDLRIDRGIICDIGHLSPRPDETVVDAQGGALFPGLNDHHIHFLSFAASLASIDCSPAAATNSEGLAELLQQHASGEGWLRGFGYHESIAGDIDCHWLDYHCPTRPVRIQHRTGRLWIFNSAGLAILQDAWLKQTTPPSLAADSFRTGRFYDSDQALVVLLGRNLPPVKRASEKLASYGVTGFSDMTPSNSPDAFALFQRLKSENSILQNVQLARNAAFGTEAFTATIPGPVKIHLHENRLPELHELVERIQSSHTSGAPIAIHCVTEIELLFSLAALEEAGATEGNRIEHASVTPEHAFDRMLQLGVTVVTQPHFILEKGDAYLHDIEPDQHDSLYRCRTFLDKNIPLAGSSDAPFGMADPWIAMRAAVERRTTSGRLLGKNEALTPEQALALFLGSLETPGKMRHIKIGMPADLCLLKHPWAVARTRLTSADVRFVTCKGTPIFSA